MTLTFLIIYCVLIIGACSNSTKGDSTTSSTSMPDYETTTLAGKIAGVSWTFDTGRVLVPSSGSGYSYSMTSDNLSNACSSTYTGSSSQPIITYSRSEGPSVGEEDLCFTTGCSKTMIFYDGSMNFIIATGKMKIETVSTTEVAGKMYAKGGSDHEINGTFTLSRCCLSGSNYALCSE